MILKIKKIFKPNFGGNDFTGWLICLKAVPKLAVDKFAVIKFAVDKLAVEKFAVGQKSC